jgi:hypothetical protein
LLLPKIVPCRLRICLFLRVKTAAYALGKRGDGRIDLCGTVGEGALRNRSVDSKCEPNQSAKKMKLGTPILIPRVYAIMVNCDHLGDETHAEV